MCYIRILWRRPRTPQEDESAVEPQTLHTVSHVRNDTNSTTTARSSTVVTKRLSSIISYPSQREKKVYSGVVFHRPLPIPPFPYTTHPHITKYSKDLVASGPHTICRCILPSAHGDAFTRRHHSEVVNKITFLSAPTPDCPSHPLTWEEAAHALLDAVGVDSRVSPGWHQENENLLRKIYAESTVKDIKKYAEVWRGVERVQGSVQCSLENDVFWWGEENPKHVQLVDLSRRIRGQSLSINGPFYGKQTHKAERSALGSTGGSDAIQDLYSL